MNSRMPTGSFSGSNLSGSIMAPVRIDHFRYIHILTCLQGFRVNSCGYTRLLPEVTQWVIALGWDRFGFLVRFSPPVTL